MESCCCVVRGDVDGVEAGGMIEGLTRSESEVEIIVSGRVVPGSVSDRGSDGSTLGSWAWMVERRPALISLDSTNSDGIERGDLEVGGTLRTA